MEYAIEMQRIIDQLRLDKAANPKWRNKVIARLEELQTFTLMLYETPSYDTMPAAPSLDDIAAGMSSRTPATPLSMDDIPLSLREHVDPSQVQP